MADQQERDLAKRAKSFALRIIRLYVALPKNELARVLGRQLLRSGTSVGAQYCEAARARSVAEFVSKAESARQELEESRYWLDLLVQGEVVSASRLSKMQQEAKELTAILVQSAKTAKKRK